MCKTQVKVEDVEPVEQARPMGVSLAPRSWHCSLQGLCEWSHPIVGLIFSYVCVIFPDRRIVASRSKGYFCGCLSLCLLACEFEAGRNFDPNAQGRFRVSIVPQPSTCNVELLLILNPSSLKLCTSGRLLVGNRHIDGTHELRQNLNTFSVSPVSPLKEARSKLALGATRDLALLLVAAALTGAAGLQGLRA